MKKTLSVFIIMAMSVMLFIGCSGSISHPELLSFEIPKEPTPYIAPGETPQEPTEDQISLFESLFNYKPQASESNDGEKYMTLNIIPGTYRKEKTGDTPGSIKVIEGTVIKIAEQYSNTKGSVHAEFTDSEGVNHIVLGSSQFDVTNYSLRISIDGTSYEINSETTEISEIFSEADQKTYQLYNDLTRYADGVVQYKFKNYSASDVFPGEPTTRPLKKVTGKRLEHYYRNSDDYIVYVDYLFDDGNKLEYFSRNNTLTFIRLNGVLLNPAKFNK